MLSRRQVVFSLLAVPPMALLGFPFTLPKAKPPLGGPLPSLGEPAPPFVLPTNTGDGIFNLQDYQGQWLVLYFYPKDFTSGCTLEAQRFQRDAQAYGQRNTQVVGISADDVDTHAAFCEAQSLEFPLLADVDGAVSRAYGSWLAPLSLRNTFIVDPQGILRAQFIGVNPATHSAEVLAELDQLQAL
jgi:thioredoxin-dependent peroxiredoxin